jgi:fructokinase
LRNIYCIGETVCDIIFKNGQPIAAKAGGSMLNSAVSLGRMNLNVHYISEYANDDIGRNIDLFLQQCNVDTHFVDHFEGKTSLAIAFLNEKNDAHYTFYKDLRPERLKIKFPEPGPEDIVLFGSSYAINIEIRDLLKTFVNSAQKNGALIIYDPNFRKAHLPELKTIRPYILENIGMASILRGSNEDFQFIFDAPRLAEAYDKISPYCHNLVYTMNSEGVRVQNKKFNFQEDVPTIEPISTIGAGDNFNAGLIYAIQNKNIYHTDLDTLDESSWRFLLRCGIDFASEVCMSYDNYISVDFANKYNAESVH